LADRILPPATLFVDATLIDAGLLTSSKNEHQIALDSPLCGDVSWQSKEAQG
jgi:hypothetical protein